MTGVRTYVCVYRNVKSDIISNTYKSFRERMVQIELVCKASSHLAPADMTGHDSGVQKSVIVPYNMFI